MNLDFVVIQAREISITMFTHDGPVLFPNELVGNDVSQKINQRNNTEPSGVNVI